MADERDPKVSRRYRELGSEEPARELDQSILAAAHRAAERPHAPLVTPAGRHRWYFAFGAAAILVLAVAVTVHIDRERPDPETVVLNQQNPPGSVARADEAAKPPAPSSAAVPRQPADARASARLEARQADSPEGFLERIAALRAEGRHDDADKALAQFRERYPDYRISAEVLQKVERRK